MAGLLALLVVVGIHDEVVFDFLTKGWQWLLAGLGLGSWATAWQQGVSGDVTRRFLPAVATYALLYLGICLLLLRLLLPDRRQWRFALGLYVGIVVVYVGLVGLGKLAGLPWAYRISRHLIDFVVSPLPVAALYVLLRVSRNSPSPG